MQKFTLSGEGMIGVSYAGERVRLPWTLSGNRKFFPIPYLLQVLPGRQIDPANFPLVHGVPNPKTKNNLFINYWENKAVDRHTPERLSKCFKAPREHQCLTSNTKVRGVLSEKPKTTRSKATRETKAGDLHILERLLLGHKLPENSNATLAITKSTRRTHRKIKNDLVVFHTNCSNFAREK